MAHKNMIANVFTDHRTFKGSVTRQANEVIEFYARPLKYGDLSEVSLTVWHDGKVHLTVRDSAGNVVDNHSFGSALSADGQSRAPQGWDSVTA